MKLLSLVLFMTLSVFVVSSTTSAQPAAQQTVAPVDPTEVEQDEEEEELDEPDIDRRAAPDFDGREDARPTAARRLLWIPRILLAPVWFVLEFVVRRPLGFLVTNVEESQVADKVVQFFTFGPNNNIALAPTFSLDFGFRPNVGFFFRWNDFIHKGHRLNLGASTGGRRWYTGQIAYRIAPKNSDWEWQIGGSATKRPDGLFFGLGSQASEENRSRFDWVGYNANMRVRGNLWRQSSLVMELSYRHRRFGDRTGGRTTIQEVIEDDDERSTLTELPPGFDGYSILRQRSRLTIDTRPSRPEPGSGVRVIGEYTVGFDANDPESLLFVNYGGSFGGYIDLTGHQHVIGLTASAVVSKSFAGETPFTELPFLSGNGPMRGFVGNFLAGESHASILLDYHWPVWNWLDGTLHAAIGNVYDGDFEDFSLGNQRISFGIGLAGVSQRDHFFEFLVGFGTDTFENGPDVESIRILFGGTREF